MEVRRGIGLSSTGKTLGFAVVEFEEVLIDWGLVRTESGFLDLLARYQPDWVAVDSSISEAYFELIRGTKTPLLLRSDADLADEFGAIGAKTEKLRAEALANQFPCLRDQLPKFVHWESESERRAIFRSLALAVTVHG